MDHQKQRGQSGQTNLDPKNVESQSKQMESQIQLPNTVKFFYFLFEAIKPINTPFIDRHMAYLYPTEQYISQK